MSKTFSVDPFTNLRLFEAFKHFASDEAASGALTDALAHEANPDASIANIPDLQDALSAAYSAAEAAHRAAPGGASELEDYNFYRDLKHFTVNLGYAPLHYAVQVSLPRAEGIYTNSITVLLEHGASQSSLCVALEESIYNARFKSIMSYSDCKDLVSNYNRDPSSYHIPAELAGAVATPLQLACMRGNAADQIKNAEEVMKLLITHGGHFDAACAKSYNVKIMYQLNNTDPYDTARFEDGRPYDTFEFLRWVVGSCTNSNSSFYSNTMEAFTSLLSLPLVKQFFQGNVASIRKEAHDTIYLPYAEDAAQMRDIIAHNDAMQGVYDALMGEAHPAGGGAGAALEHAA